MCPVMTIFEGSVPCDFDKSSKRRKGVGFMCFVLCLILIDAVEKRPT